VRHVADSLRLSPESVRHLLSGLSVSGAPGAGSKAPPSAPPRLLAAEHDLEARFLAACLALPERGRELVAAVDESYFADAGARRAYEAVRERLEPQGAGSRWREAGPAQTSAGAQEDMLPEVLLRASGEQFNERVLQELHLRLQEAHVSRLIRKASSRLKVAASTDESAQEETRLLELDGIRRRLRDAIRLIPVEE
jgi:hypothetical protein